MGRCLKASVPKHECPVVAPVDLSLLCLPGDMYRICRVYLVFLGAVLQAVAVEAKGGKGGKSGGSGGGGSGGGTIGGVIVGVIAGTYRVPTLANLSALTTVCSAAVILYAMVLKYRPYVMKCLRRSPPRGGKLQANRASKDPDFERNAVEGYPPQDIPVYVSTFASRVHF